MNWIFNNFGGKSSFFAFVFMVSGIVLAFLGHLTTTYLGLAASIQTLLVTRAVMDDVHERAAQNNGVEKK